MVFRSPHQSKIAVYVLPNGNRIACRLSVLNIVEVTVIASGSDEVLAIWTNGFEVERAFQGAIEILEKVGHSVNNPKIRA